MRRIGLTGWEIFSKLDAVKWTLNQAEDISQRVFRLLKGPSIPESNQRGKRNKNHMSPLIQLKKATPLFGIALLLACFALSPQAFAQTWTFNPNEWSGCQNSKNVTISRSPSGGGIFVWIRNAQFPYNFQTAMWITNPGTIPVGPLPPSKKLEVYHTRNRPIPGTVPVLDSGPGYSGTYSYQCGPKPRPRPTPHPRP